MFGPASLQAGSGAQGPWLSLRPHAASRAVGSLFRAKSPPGHRVLAYGNAQTSSHTAAMSEISVRTSGDIITGMWWQCARRI